MSTSISNSYSFGIDVNGISVLSVSLDTFQLPYQSPEYVLVKAMDKLRFSFSRSFSGSSVRLKLGDEQVALCTEESKICVSSEESWLYNEIGESCLIAEQQSPEDEKSFYSIFEVQFLIEPRSSVARDFDVMVEDLTRIHENLAHDVIAKSHIRYGIRSSGTLRLIPITILGKLSSLYNRIFDVVNLISAQPSHVLRKSREISRYRPGDQIEAVGLSSFPENTFDINGNVISISKGHIRRPFLTSDTPEHRHLAFGIRLLEKRAADIAQHFDERAEILYKDAIRWGTTSSNKPSVFHQVIAPKIDQLEEYACKAKRISSDLGNLRAAHSFLYEAGEPRTPFCMTPTFRGRAAYRAAYEVLSDARALLGVLIDGDAIKVAHRSLSSLYEYWCFIKTVELLANRLGTPFPDPTIKLIHGVYRPELLPGQKFVFEGQHGKTVVVSYEPDINPWDQAIRRNEVYGASLTSKPLRPDIMIEILSSSNKTVVLILDAKSTDRFTSDKFRDTSDYSRQIIELKGLCMPVKQVFLLHRDALCKEVLNLPTYFQQNDLADNISIIGGVACLPEYTGCVPEGLEKIIDKFLEHFA
jgi:hypothetical protein